MQFVTLPFKKVQDFDYQEIANNINENNPDIIWVSLGAPKQEEFMSKLLPYINRGVMFGFGAIFNFYSMNTTEKRAPKIFLKLHIEWIYRIFNNPKKQLPKIKKTNKDLHRGKPLTNEDYILLSRVSQYNFKYKI